MQLVAALNINQSNNDKKAIEDLTIIDKDCDFGEDIVFYAFIRDIHFENGFQLLTTTKEVKNNFNTLAICNSKLFSIPQSFILKSENIEELMSQQVILGEEAGQVNNTYNLLTDLLT